MCLYWPRGASPGTPIHTALCPHLSPALDLALPLLALCSAPVSCTPRMSNTREVQTASRSYSWMCCCKHPRELGLCSSALLLHSI